MRPAFAIVLLAAAGLPAIAKAAAPAPLCTDPGRACLERSVNAYYAGLLRADGSAVPFAETVRATEQQEVKLTTRAAFLSEFRSSGAIKGLRNIRFITDEKTGDVVAFLLVDVGAVDGAKPFTVRRAQRFRVRRGLITEVEIINFYSPTSAALWPDPVR